MITQKIENVFLPLQNRENTLKMYTFFNLKLWYVAAFGKIITYFQTGGVLGCNTIYTH